VVEPFFDDEPPDEPGIVSVSPGRIRLVDFRPFAFSSDDSDTPWRRAMPSR
jgi:hypothetical protein